MMKPHHCYAEKSADRDNPAVHPNKPCRHTANVRTSLVHRPIQTSPLSFNSMLPLRYFQFPHIRLLSRYAIRHIRAPFRLSHAESCDCFIGGLTMHKQLGRVGTVRREIQGKACSFCGGYTYQLVLRASGLEEESRLFARCSQCHHPRSVDDSFGTVLWM